MEIFSTDEITEQKPTRRVCRPCEQKGSYLGRLDCGWRDKASSQSSQSCELLCRKKCDRLFEHEHSIGTKQFVSLNSESKFPGCTQVEQSLLADGLLSPEPHLMEVLSHDPLAMTPYRDEDAFLVPDIDRETASGKRRALRFITGPAATFQFVDDLNKERIAYDRELFKKRPSPETPLASLLGSPPESLEHLHFRNLIENGYIESHCAPPGGCPSQNEERVWTMFFANLLVRGYWDKDIIKEIFPSVDLSKFEVIKRKICLHVRKTLPRKALQFEAFWRKLTFNQREAVWLYYMQNPYSRSKDFVAEKIGISVESLKDRLAGAIKKLKGAFPELQVVKERELSDEDVLRKPVQPKKPAPLPVRQFTADEIAHLELQRAASPSSYQSHSPTRKFQTWREYKAFTRLVMYHPIVNGTW